MVYQRFIITEHVYPEDIKLGVKIPQICPICGSSATIPLKISNIYINPIKNFEVLICGNHQEFREPSFTNILLTILSLFIPIFLFMLSIIVFKNLMLATIFLVIFAVYGFSLLGYALLKERRKRIRLRDILFLESFEKGSVLSVKNSLWSQEFIKLNSCPEIDRFLNDKLERIEKKQHLYRRLQYRLIYFGVFFTLGMIISLISSGLMNEPYSSYLISLSEFLQLLLFFLVIFTGYNFLYRIEYKTQKAKQYLYWDF